MDKIKEFPTSFSFTRIPKVFFYDPRYAWLSNAAKVLYSLLFDRMSLSEENGWRDPDGNTYQYNANAELQVKLNSGHDKVTRCFRELERVGLVMRKKQGLGRPDMIYVLPFSTECDPAAVRSDQNEPSVKR